MTVASFVAAQRTDHGVPHVTSCRAPGGLAVVVLQVAQPASDTAPTAAGDAG